MAHVSTFQRLSRLDAHHRLVVALGFGFAVFLLLRKVTGLPTTLIATWNTFAYGDLLLAWITIIWSPHDHIRRRAAQQDTSRTILFVLVVIAASSSLLAIGLLLGPTKGLPESSRAGHAVLSVFAVIASWLLVHTVFTMRYAHHFYHHTKHNTDAIAGGVVFPGEDHPDYMDFAYFAFVIGMTCQVSDVQITSRPIRQLALFHGVLSFAFNTIVLALSVNVIAGLL